MFHRVFRYSIPAIFAILFGISSAALAAESATKVLIETSKGNIEVQLAADKAPATVENFLTYVKEGFYTDTLFHRVIPNFMIQGGGLDASFTKKPTHDPIQIEADNGLLNSRGTIAMARTNSPNSATSQFFINLVDNAMLNHKSKSLRGWGYTVFGEVTQGMDIVDEIAKVETGVNQGRRDVPKTPVIIKSISIVTK